MRRFEIRTDMTLGALAHNCRIAQGCQFSDATVAVRWLNGPHRTILLDSIDDLIAAHCHDGRNHLLWLDGPESAVTQ